MQHFKRRQGSEESARKYRKLANSAVAKPHIESEIVWDDSTLPFRRPGISVVQPFEFQVLDIHEQDLKHPITQKSTYAVRMFGSTDSGASVDLSIFDWRPRFYVLVPEHHRQDAWIQKLQRYLNTQLQRTFKYNVENAFATETDTAFPLQGYHEAPVPFVRVSTASLFIIRKLHSLFCDEDDKFILPAGSVCDCDLCAAAPQLRTFERKLPSILRFFHEQHCSPSGWIRVEQCWAFDSFNAQCSAVLWTSPEHISPLDRVDVGPMLVLSFDLECFSPDGMFPRAERDSDSIIQISAVLRYYRFPVSPEQNWQRHLFSLGTCRPAPAGVIVHEFEDSRAGESRLIGTFFDMVARSDADLILGFNMHGFDMPYLWNRAEYLNSIGFPGAWEKRSCWSRIAARPQLRVSETFSAAKGDQRTCMITSVGRIQLDLMQLIKVEYKLPQNSLDVLSRHFLGQQKVDLSPADIWRFYLQVSGGRPPTTPPGQA